MPAKTTRIERDFPSLVVIGKTLHRYSERAAILLSACNKSVDHGLHLYGFDEAEGRLLERVMKRCPTCFPVS